MTPTCGLCTIGADTKTKSYITCAPPPHLFTGKNIRPHKALKMGLVDQLVDPASLEAVAIDAAASLAAGTLKAKRRPKSLVNRLIEDTPPGRAIVWKKVYFRTYIRYSKSVSGCCAVVGCGAALRAFVTSRSRQPCLIAGGSLRKRVLVDISVSGVT